MCRKVFFFATCGGGCFLGTQHTRTRVSPPGRPCAKMFGASAEFIDPTAGAFLSPGYKGLLPSISIYFGLIFGRLGFSFGRLN